MSSVSAEGGRVDKKVVSRGPSRSFQTQARTPSERGGLKYAEIPENGVMRLLESKSKLQYFNV